MSMDIGTGTDTIVHYIPDLFCPKLSKSYSTRFHIVL